MPLSRLLSWAFQTWRCPSFTVAMSLVRSWERSGPSGLLDRRKVLAARLHERYTSSMSESVTTMRITAETRDRLRTHASTGETLEDVVVHALDAYEAAQCWTRAEAWAAAETPAEREARKASEAEWDALMDGLR